eukprot:752594-Hanusia_phi.AAC.11
MAFPTWARQALSSDASTSNRNELLQQNELYKKFAKLSEKGARREDEGGGGGGEKRVGGKNEK